MAEAFQIVVSEELTGKGDKKVSRFRGRAQGRYKIAVEEAENVLIAYAKEQQRREALTAATAAASQVDQLVRDQYQVGLVPFNNVLDAQRSLLFLQDELAISSGAVTSNLVRLYKALGGGWVSLDPVEDKSENLAKDKSQVAR